MSFHACFVVSKDSAAPGLRCNYDSDLMLCSERAAGANEWRPLGDAKKPSKVGGNEAVGKNIQNDHQQRMQRSETMKQVMRARSK